MSHGCGKEGQGGFKLGGQGASLKKDSSGVFQEKPAQTSWPRERMEQVLAQDSQPGVWASRVYATQAGGDDMGGQT